MTPLHILLIVVACLAVTAAVAVGIAWNRPRHGLNGPGVADIEQRVDWQDYAPPSEPAALWPFSSPHTEPDEPFTVEQAHRTMQWHRRCRADSCPRKEAAFRALVAAGRVVPDPRADGYAR